MSRSRLRNPIIKANKPSRFRATVLEVINGRATVRLANNALMRNIRVIGITAAGNDVYVEWNGHEQIIYAPGNTAISSTTGITVVAPRELTTSFQDPLTLNGWVIGEDQVLRSDATRIEPDGAIELGTEGSDDILRLDSGDATYRMWVGNQAAASAPFSIQKTGAVKATSGEIAGWTLSASGIQSSDNKAALVPGSYPHLRLGDATDYNTGTGVFAGKTSVGGDGYKMHIGNPLGDHLRWDGTNLIITGFLYGGIAGAGTTSDSWTISTDGNDANIDLVWNRTTGGQATMRWNGGVLSLDKTFQTQAINAEGDITLTNNADLLVGANVLAVNNYGARVGINRVADPQFSLDVAGNLRADILVGQHAIQLPEAKLILHFDNDLHGHMGQVPLTQTSVDFLDPGMFLQGIAVDSATNLSYYSLNNIDEDLGTLMFWVKPSAGAYWLIRHINGTTDIEVGYASGWIIARRGTEELAIEVTEGAWNHVTFTWDDGDVINLYANGLDARHPVCDYYVNSVSGDDDNDGLTEATAWQTIAKLLTVLDDGDIVGLACGSEFREAIIVGTSGTPWSACTVRAYGTGNKPHLRCDDLISAGSWSKTGGYTNVYEVTLAHDYSASEPSWASLWIDGVRMTRQTSIALVDANPGTYYAINENSASDMTVYVHSTSSTNPGSDGKTYEIAVRHSGIYGYFSTNITAVGIKTSRNHCDGGSLKLGRFSQIVSCEVNEGSKHSVYLRTGGDFIGGVITDAYYGANTSTLLAINEGTPTDEDSFLAFTTYKFIRTDLAGLVGIMNSHNNVSGYFGTVTIAHCRFENSVSAGLQFAMNHCAAVNFINPVFVDCYRGLGVPSSYAPGCEVTVTGGYWSSDVDAQRAIDLTTIGCPITVNGMELVAEVALSLALIVMSTTCDLTLNACKFRTDLTTGWRACIYAGSNNITLAINNCEFNLGTGTWSAMYYFVAGSSSMTWTADNNIFSNTFSCTVAGTNYTVFATFQAAVTPNDANSSVAASQTDPTPVNDIVFYPASYSIDDVAITGTVISSGMAIAIYESAAPVFAETSVRGFSILPQLVWADEKGLWAIDNTGDAVLGVSAVDDESWGGFTLDKGDISFGSLGASEGGWLLFDRSAGELSLGYASGQTIKFTPSGAEFAGVLGIGSSGGIWQGSSGTFGSPNTGLKIYTSSSKGIWEAWSGGYKQVYLDTNLALNAAEGNIILDREGLHLRDFGVAINVENASAAPVGGLSYESSVYVALQKEVLALSFGADAVQKTVLNPGFESGTSNWTCNSLLSGSSGGVTFTVENTGHTGSKSAKLLIQEPDQLDGDSTASFVSDFITASPNKHYTLSFFYKLDQSGLAPPFVTAAISFYNSSDTFLDSSGTYLGESTNWTKRRIQTFTSPATTAKIKVTFYFYIVEAYAWNEYWQLWLDDIDVIETSSVSAIELTEDAIVFGVKDTPDIPSEPAGFAFTGGQVWVYSGESAYGLKIGDDTQIYRDSANVLRTPDTFVIDGDIRTDAFQTYNTTVGNVASTSTKNFYYKKVGNLVFCMFYIVGTKDGSTGAITLSLPYTADSAIRTTGVARVSDGSNWYPGYLYLPAGGSSTLNIYHNVDGVGFTANNAFTLEGQFFYEV